MKVTNTGKATIQVSGVVSEEVVVIKPKSTVDLSKKALLPSAEKIISNFKDLKVAAKKDADAAKEAKKQQEEADKEAAEAKEAAIAKADKEAAEAKEAAEEAEKQQKEADAAKEEAEKQQKEADAAEEATKEGKSDKS